MSSYTKNLNLIKPVDTDPFTVEHANSNMEKIDNAYGKVATLTGTVAPTTSTVGVNGQFYLNTDTKILYQCINVVGSVYTWESLTNMIPEVKKVYDSVTDKYISVKLSDSYDVCAGDKCIISKGYYSICKVGMYFACAYTDTSKYICVDIIDCTSKAIVRTVGIGVQYNTSFSLSITLNPIENSDTLFGLYYNNSSQGYGFCVMCVSGTHTAVTSSYDSLQYMCTNNYIGRRIQLSNGNLVALRCYNSNQIYIETWNDGAAQITSTQLSQSIGDFNIVGVYGNKVIVRYYMYRSGQTYDTTMRFITFDVDASGAIRNVNNFMKSYTNISSGMNLYGYNSIMIGSYAYFTMKDYNSVMTYVVKINVSNTDDIKMVPLPVAVDTICGRCDDGIMICNNEYCCIVDQTDLSLVRTITMRFSPHIVTNNILGFKWIDGVANGDTLFDTKSSKFTKVYFGPDVAYGVFGVAGLNTQTSPLAFCNGSMMAVSTYREDDQYVCAGSDKSTDAWYSSVQGQTYNGVNSPVSSVANIKFKKKVLVA